MPEIRGTVTRCAPRMIERRDGTGSFPLYEVWLDGQGPWVARKDIYGQAERLQGQVVEAVVRDEERNGFLNHYMDFISPAGGQQPLHGSPTTSVQPASQPQAAARDYTTAEQVMTTPSPAEERKELSIHRQTASKVAATLGGTPIDFWVNAEALVRFYQSGVIPDLAQFGAQTIPRENPQPQQHQNAAAYRQYREEPGNQYTGDPGRQPGMPNPEDSDIPFAPTIDGIQ